MDEASFHRERRAAIVRDIPAVKLLFGKNQSTAWFAGAAVVLQFSVAALIADQRWWVAFIAAYGIGAFIAHYLNVVIHECSHNLVFRDSALNKAFGIFANLPALAPSAIAFRHYHLLHHKFLGRPRLDADVPLPWEARLIGRSRLGKLIWLLIQPFTYSVLHPMQVRRTIAVDRWLIANVIVILGVAAFVAWHLGAMSVLYLALSTYFAVGPHPTGAHILQEHFIFQGSNETTSYYGPMNLISINHGLHVEHHDFPNVPGSRLGDLRRIAPQYYNPHFHHRSRLATLWHFVMDPRISLNSRAVHPDIS
jgi:sphingolipid 4-desaturase/C4-monooxygenase